MSAPTITVNEGQITLTIDGGPTGLSASGIVGALTLTKSGITARTATFPDAAITVAGINLAQTWTADQTFDVIKTNHCDARTSAGVHIGNLTHQDVAIFGAGGSQGTTFYGQINGTSLALSGAASCTVLTTVGGHTEAVTAYGTSGTPVENKVTIGAIDPSGQYPAGVYAVNSFSTNLNHWLRFKTCNAGSAQIALTLSPDGTAAFINSVSCTALTASGGLTITGAGSVLSKDAYSSAYPILSLSTVKGLALMIDPSAVAGGSFGANNTEIMVPRGLKFLSPNVGGTDWEAAGMTVGTVTTSGGTMTVPSSTQVIAAAGKVYAGDTSATSIQTAGGITIASANYIYLRGDASTDDSVRFSSQSAGTMLIEKRASGSWVSIGSFA